MNKFLLGLVLGTLLGFLFAHSVSDKGGEDIAPPAVHTASVDVADRPKLVTGPAASIAGEPPPALQGTASTIGSSGASPVRDAGTAPEGGATMQAQPAHQIAAASSPRTPIAVPEAIKPFLAKTDTHDGLTLGQMHSKLEEEPDDLAWSYQMELYLQQSLVRPTKSGQPLDIRVIECRSTMCEIAGFSPLANPTDDVSAAVQFMTQQPWWDFDNFNSTAAGDGSGGKFIVFLRRKR
jgi:hypothetical protein